MFKRMLEMTVDKIMDRVLNAVIDAMHNYLDGLCNGFGE